jgi:hypothetical protein
MSSTYYPIVSHGGIPNMIGKDGSITTKHLLKDTQVGKRKVAILPHLIANTVDNLARGMVYKSQEIEGEPSLIKKGTAGKLVTDTKRKIERYEELTASEKETRALHKKVGMRMRSH